MDDNFLMAAMKKLCVSLITAMKKLCVSVIKTKTKLEMDFANKPFETNRLKERFVNYYSNKMPGSPVMSELYWDAHDDLVDPNRYDMGTEAHSGVYQLSFLGRKEFVLDDGL